MKIGIMQPYLFPYLGYFQLINCVDKFIVYDDVQFINRGWINRNRILINSMEYTFTFSLKKDSHLKNINERFYSDNFNEEINKFLNTIERSYKKARNFSETYELLLNIFNFQNKNLAEFNMNSLKMICSYLNINSQLIFSSQIQKNNDLKGQDKIIHINKILKASWYINPIGGIDLYSSRNFESNNIRLNFIKMGEIQYRQFSKEFIPNLSIIDVLMFNRKDEINSMLASYTLE